MAKIELHESRTRAGGRDEKHDMTFEANENELAMMEKGLGDFLRAMGEEQVRHNKAREDLDNRRFEYEKERDEYREYWKQQYDELHAELNELREKLRQAESDLWDWEHGLKRPESKSA